MENSHGRATKINNTQKGYQNRWVSKSQVLGTAKTRNFGARAILVPVWVVLWHPKGYQNRWFSKWQVQGTFETRKFGSQVILKVARLNFAQIILFELRTFQRKML